MSGKAERRKKIFSVLMTHLIIKASIGFGLTWTWEKNLLTGTGPNREAFLQGCPPMVLVKVKEGNTFFLLRGRNGNDHCKLKIDNCKLVSQP